MPKKARELSAVEVKRLSQKLGFHAVGGVAGLHLAVSSPAASSWILRVVIGDDRPDLGLGPYPEIGVALARDKAREAREQIRRGVDPRQAKKDAAAALRASTARAMTFEEAAKACHATKSAEFSSAKHSNDWINSLQTHAYPVLARVPVNEIDLPHVVKVLEPIWKSKTETATRVRQRIESTLDWATVSKFRSGENPARWDGNLEHALAKPSKVRDDTRHHPALPWPRMGEFMAELRKKSGMGARALEFAILTAARSIEVRGATWSEIDLKAKLWTVPASRIKGRRIHKVPLSAPAIDLLKALPRLEGSPYVFPAMRGGRLSDMTLSKAIKDMHEAHLARGGEGYLDPEMGAIATPHGTARSSFKDWCRNCATQFSDEVSELQIAHVNSDATRAAYARDQLLSLRRELMPLWAKHCGTAKKGARR